MNEINNKADMKKMEAYLRVKAKGQFTFKPDLLKDVLSELKKCAEDLHIDITVETVDATNREVLLLTSSGALIGSVVGYMLAYIPGALFGCIVGATIGAVISGITCTVRHEDEQLVLQLA